jgi:hypothetical protein
MQIAISAPGQFITISPEEPEVGRVYQLDEADSPTERQNRAFHALVQEYWKSGAHSYKAKSFEEFREQIKRHLGAGFESFDYADVVDGQVRIFRHMKRGDIPEYVWAKREFTVRGNLKSWSKYTKKERREAIDSLIAEMLQVGVNTKHFHEILDGMEEGNREAC